MRAGLVALLLLAALPGVAAAAVDPGFGATTGGAGHAVVRVTTLADSGPGSLRAALEGGGERTIVFDVGGEIHLQAPLFVSGAFVTIDGFSAPSPVTLVGDGLILRGSRGSRSAHDVIVRGLRVRGAPFDGIQVARGASNILIHHVSVWGAGDGLIDITDDARNVTVAWSILAGSVKAMLIKYRAARVTLHHNLFVSGRNRNPSVAVDDASTPAGDTTLDMRNNVVWDWGGGSGTAIHHGAWANVVANFYSSPASGTLDKQQALIVCRGDGCYDGDPNNIARAYARDNVSGDFLTPDINAAGTETEPFPAAPVTTDAACTAARQVLAGAGVRPLDDLDASYLAPIVLPLCRRTQMVVASSGTESLYGQEVTFTARVAPVLPSSDPPSGAVTFRVGTVVLGTAPLADGIATLPVTDLSPGKMTVSAVHGGDPDFDASTASIDHRVYKMPTTTALLASAETVGGGAPVALTAVVGAAEPVATPPPAGKVRFRDGGSSLGTATLVNGTAVLGLSSLPAGYRQLTAEYLGDSSFVSSLSPVLVVGVEGGTVAVLDASETTLRFGQPTTLTATVASTPPGTAVPTGSVTFKRGSTSLASVALSGGGAALTTTLPVGSHGLTAAYPGHGDFLESTSAKVTIKVLKGQTQTALDASASLAAPGETVTLTATVTAVAPAAGVPAGKVVFKDNGKTLTSVVLKDGAARLQTSSLAPGSHSIVAIYDGDGSFEKSTSPAVGVAIR